MSRAFLLGALLALGGCTKAPPGPAAPEPLPGSHLVPDARPGGDFSRAVPVAQLEAEAAAERDPVARARLLARLGGIYATKERTLPLALERYEAARKIADPALALDLQAKIGIVQLRIGELANCSKYHNRDSCIFPLSALAQHRDRAGSEAALATFRDYLRGRPDDALISWLAGVAEMTLGGPGAKALTASFFPAAADFPRFENVSGSAGLVPPGPLGGGGVVIEDFNGDGYLDVVFSSSIPGEPLRYFESNGHDGFTDKTESSGIGKFTWAHNLTPTDYDNDGNVDLLLSRWEPPSLEPAVARTALLRSNGDGTFRDVTEEAGLLGEPGGSVSAASVDFDGDGWLDLLICNRNRELDFYHNDHGRFTRLNGRKGIPSGRCDRVIAGDVNNDGYPDLLLTNYSGKNEYYRNNGDGTFRRAPEAGLDEGPWSSGNGWIFDYDNDGWPDVFLNTLDLNVTDMILDRQGRANGGRRQRLYRNRGDGTFEDVTSAVGLDQAIPTMGGNFGDVDNSGYPSIYLGTGGLSLSDIVPNIFFLNQGGKKFADVSVPGGFSSLQDGHGIGFADVDNDGQQDVVISLGGDYESIRFFPQLLRNPGSPNHWVTLRLRGRRPRTNALAIGARVKVTVDAPGGDRSYYATSGRGGSMGANNLAVHLGLGKARKIRSVEIVWPGYPEPQVIRGLAMDRIYGVEQDKSPAPLPLRRMVYSRKETHHHHP